MTDVLHHGFASPRADSADPTQVQPSHWNAGHKFQGGGDGNVLLRDSTDATFGAKWGGVATFASNADSGGTIHNWNPTNLVLTSPALVLSWVGTAPTNITGIVAAPFRYLTIRNFGTSHIAFLYNDSGSLETNRLFTLTQTTPTALGPGGWITFFHNASGWVMVDHDQGGPIAYTPVWGNTGTANVLGGGSCSGTFVVRGKYVFVEVTFTFGAGSVAGSGAFTFTLPYSPTSGASTRKMAGPALIFDFDTGTYGAMCQLFSPTTFVVYQTNGVSTGINGSVPMTWVPNDNLCAQLMYEVG